MPCSVNYREERDVGNKTVLGEYLGFRAVTCPLAYQTIVHADMSPPSLELHFKITLLR